MKTILVLSLSLALPTLGLAQAGDNPATGPTVDPGSALVQLQGAPLSTSDSTKPRQGKKIDFKSEVVKSYRAQLGALRNDFKAWLRVHAPNAKVTGEFDIALNAVCVELNGTTLEILRQSPLV